MSRRVALGELHRFAADALRAVGMSVEHAGWTADGLVWADAHDLPAHGVSSKLVQCVARVRAGGTDATAPVVPVLERPAYAVLDACDGWGQVAGTDAMRRAVAKAGALGVGAVSVRRTSSAAAMGYYADLAASAGMLGIAVTNGPPLVAAPGGTRRVVSNMGHAVAAPAGEHGRVLYDTATTTMSTGQMDLHRERGEELPEGVLRDAQGEPTRDPSLWSTGLLEPIGGHRGFGLSIALELLTGVLAGGERFGDEVGLPTRHDETQGVSLMMIAVAPAEGVDLAARAQELVDRVVASGPDARTPGLRAVTAAARAEWEGVPYGDEQLERLGALADELDVAPLGVTSPAAR
ncbi:Ldh family oxidoreductase [Janibacter sp. UYMM211]|uniref:Ldh family oxidoreductase n=1 Tax=Janibacter sp. UYMM211 TaxID=3156342 RepID=UPI00339A463B